ncbi:MAG: hypothetical protein CVU87_06045 [Firmicutes bacterium HGW-Firmicutes-12]|nr:MAG: hypothetical protein CVU87_06045 [Firmicutes bacterium HGW-Firmicutes-12]
MERRGFAWYIESNDKSIDIRKQEGDSLRLITALEWSKYISGKRKGIVPEIVQTTDKQDYVVIDNSLYYATLHLPNEEFKSDNQTHLLYAINSLAHIHRLSCEFEVKLAVDTETILWPRIIQEKLASLIWCYNRFKEHRKKTDFERIFLENFSFIYDQGQECLENMIMGGYNVRIQERSQILINSFLKQNLAVVNNELIFLDLCRWTLGPVIMDIILFLNSFLSKHKWDVVLFRKLLNTYEEHNSLNQQDKHFLLGLLRFPYRLWLYAYQYNNHVQSVPELTQKLELYMYESYYRDRCLDDMDSWLWGDENEKPNR